MTSIRFHYRSSTKNGADDGKLYIRLIHNRRSRTLATEYKVRATEWDRSTHDVKLITNSPNRLNYLLSIRSQMKEDIQRLESIIQRLKSQSYFDIEEVIREWKEVPQSYTLMGYCEKIGVMLENQAQPRTARAYRSAVKSFQKYLSGSTLKLSDINARNIKAYEQALLEQGLFPNTVSFYMRQLRAIYNRAIRDKLIRYRVDHPFEDVYTGVYKTKRRALTEKELNNLASLEFQLEKRIKSQGKDADLNLKLKKALNLFLFCFHARGLSFVDLAYLKKSDIGKDTIIYKRRKTGRFLEVGITRPMRAIIQFFSSEVQHSPYVFPIIKPSGGCERKQYEVGLQRQNKLLGILSERAGLTKKVTTHVSRHTWASVAKWRKVSVSVISEALGHRDFRTTEYYLASFDQSVLDKLSHEMSGVIKKSA